MRFILQRRYLRPEHTIGRLYLNGVDFCDTIEDHYRDLNVEKKVFGETCIGYGTYKVELSMSPKFKRLLPMILDVDQFTGIRIHRGNEAKDSHGCILPGENRKKGMVLYSAKYEKWIVKEMKAATKRGEEITIEIV